VISGDFERQLLRLIKQPTGKGEKVERGDIKEKEHV